MGAEGRVLRVQTREWPLLALAEFSLTIQFDDPYIKYENGTIQDV